MTAITRRRVARTYDTDDTRLLRFIDGLVVDPDDCPKRIHTRSHWLRRGVCRCGQPEPASAARRCRGCGDPIGAADTWCSTRCFQSEDGHTPHEGAA